jgi:hypothetical protein
MNVRKVTKFVVGSLAGSGAAMIMNGVITEHTHPRSLKQKCAVIAARVVLSALVAETTKRQSDKMVDETMDSIRDLRKDWAELKRVIRGEEPLKPPSPAPEDTDTTDK